MTQESGGNLLVWRVLILIGVAGNIIGVFGEIPALSVVFAPIAIIGLIGLIVNQRKKPSTDAPENKATD